MPSATVNCPSCARPLNVHHPLPPHARLKCPACGLVFAPPSEDEAEAQAPDPAAAASSRKRILAEMSASNREPEAKKPRSTGRKVLMGCALALTLFGIFASGAVALLFAFGFLARDRAMTQEPQPARRWPNPPLPDKPLQIDDPDEPPLQDHDDNQPPFVPPSAAEREKRRLALQAEEQAALAELLKRGAFGASGQLLNLVGHKETVKCLTFSPDGKILASGGDDNTIKLWDVHTGKEIRTLEGHKKSVTSLIFSPDGATLMSSEDGTSPQLFWDVATGKQKASLGGKHWLHDATFSLDGRTLVSTLSRMEETQTEVFWKPTIKLNDLRRGAELKSVELLPKGSPESLALSPDGKTAAVTTDEGTVWVGDPNTGAEKWTRPLGLKGAIFFDAVFSPDGKVLAVGGRALGRDAAFLKIVDAETGQVKHTLVDSKLSLRTFAFSPDGSLLAVSGDFMKKGIKIWDVATGKERPVSDLPDDRHAFAFSPGGEFLAVSSSPYVRLLSVKELLNPSVHAILEEVKKSAEITPQGDGYSIAMNKNATDASLAVLAKLPGVTRLNLRGSDAFTDAGLTHLRGMTSLRGLSLGFSPGLTDAGLANLAGLTSLVSLDLTGFDNLTDVGLAHLKTLTNLKELILWERARVTGAGLAALEGMTRLERLDLDGIRVGDTGVEHLAGLTNLKTLKLLRAGITDKGMASLKGLTQLHELVLKDNPGVTGEGMIHLAGMTELRELELALTKASDAGLASLKGMKNLYKLDLLKTDVTDAGLAHLADLSDLWEVEIGGVKGITGSGLKHLANKKIRKLNLEGTGVTDEGLANIAGMTELTSLYLPEALTDEGLKHLEKLTKISYLSFGKQEGVKGSGLKYLKGLTRVTRLGLAQTGVDDAGLESLKEMTQLDYLALPVGSSRVDLQACKLEYSIVSPK